MLDLPSAIASSKLIYFLELGHSSKVNC